MRRAIIAFWCLLLVGVVHAHYIDPTYGASLHTPLREPPLTGELTKLEVTLYNASAQPVTTLDVVHERKLHVFIVGQDLRTFAHLHPEDFSDGYWFMSQGRYVLSHTFPYAGFYSILVDYTSEGTTSMSAVSLLVVGNNSFAPTVYDFNRTKQLGEYTVTLQAPRVIVVNESTPLDLHVQYQGEDVHTLEQYLGSEVHAVIVQDQLRSAVHTHAFIPGHARHTGVLTQRYVGPTVPVRHTFSEVGVYSVFEQFQHNGQVRTAQFFVQVEAQRPAEPTLLWWPWAGAVFAAVVLTFYLRYLR